jgi:hypothetical protein
MRPHFIHMIQRKTRQLLLGGLIAFLIMHPAAGYSQQDTMGSRFHIGVFLPLYLDSAYDAAGNFRYSKTLPSFMNAGMESYLGILSAIDTLKKEGLPIDIHLFDSRSAKTKPETLISSDSLKDMHLLLGQVNVNEAALLSRYAAARKIPFVNLNLPNEAGSTANPYHILLNPTLSTHCAAIYKFLQKNYALAPIVMFRKKGAQEDRIRNFFADAEKNTAGVPLKIRWVNVEDTLDTEQLRLFLDSTKTTICVAGSLDLNFGTTLCRQLSTLSKSYKSILVGMPTWEQADFSRSAYRGVEVLYPTPHYVAPDNKLAQRLQSQLKSRFYARTGDYTYRAFETLFWLAHLNNIPADQLLQKIQQPANLLFTAIDVQPVPGKPGTAPAFSENKKLYFIKKIDGQSKGAF